MKLYQIWLANGAAFALFKCYLIPKLRSYIEYNRSVGSIQKGATLALSSWIETILLLGVISGGIVLSFTLLFQLAGGTAEAVGHAIERLQEGRRWLTGFGPKWGSVVLVFGVIALGIYANRRGKLRMTRAFDIARDRELERLSRESTDGSWEELPPTGEMQRVSDHAVKLVAALGQPEYMSARDQIVADLDRLKEIYFQLDIQRRLDMRLSPEEAALPEPQTWVEKVQTFFISRGLWGALNRPGRTIYLCNVALLIPCLLGVYSLSADSAFNQRFVNLAELQVELSQQEALKTWQNLQPAPDEEIVEDRDLDEDEVRTLQQTARVYERSLARAKPFESFRVSSAANERAIRSELVRRDVLKGAAEAAPDSVAEVMPESIKNVMGTKELAAWDAFQKTDPSHSTTLAGGRVFEELAAHARRSPSEFVAKLKVALQTPVAQADLATSIGREVLDSLIGNHLGEAGTFLDGLEPATRTSFSSAVETKSRRFVAEIIRTDGAGVAEAVAAVEKKFARDMAPGPLAQFQDFTRSHPLSPGDGDGLIATIKQRPPALDPMPDPRTDSTKVIEIIRQQVAGTDNEKLSKAFYYSEPLREFSSYFPASEESFMASFDSSTIHSLVGDIERSGEILKSRSTSRVKSARIFGELNTSPDVGGVLMGVTPEPSSKELEFPTFSWELDGETVRFTLTDGQGNSSLSRWWDATIAHQALTYAADGRPLAVTIVSCSPLMDQKVLLHAALVDTGLGYRMIELDHFVSEYVWEGKGNPQLKRDWDKADMLVRGHVDLYEYALERRSILVAEKLLPMITEEGRRVLRSDIERMNESQRKAEKPLAGGELSLAAKALAQGSNALQDNQSSILMAKPDYFEKSIVEAMIAAIKPKQSLSAFGDALEKAFHIGIPSEFEARKEMLGEQAPRISMVSGVREKPFRVELPEFFVLAGDKIPEVLDYVMQVTFETAARGDIENTADPNPWQFPLLAERIRAAVANGIATDERTQAVHECANEFAFLQRFFRLGFDGMFGENFPIEKFADLSRELRAAAPSASLHTIRWNTRPNAREMALRDFIKGIEGTPAMKECEDLLPMLDEITTQTNALEAAKCATSGHEEAWNTFASARQGWKKQLRVKAEETVARCKSSGLDDENLKVVLFLLEELRVSNDLRDALGVPSDDRQCWLDKATRLLPPVRRNP